MKKRGREESTKLTLSRGDHSELRESNVVADSESDPTKGCEDEKKDLISLEFSLSVSTKARKSEKRDGEREREKKLTSLK